MSSGEFNPTLPRLSSSAEALLEPLAALTKVFRHNITTVMPEGYPPSCDTSVNRARQLGADRHSAWQSPEPLTFFAVSGMNKQYRIAARYITPRRIIPRRDTSTGTTAPTKSAMVSHLLVMYSRPIGDANIGDFLNIRPHVAELNGMMKMALSVSDNHYSWLDEASIIRTLAGLINCAPDSAWLRSTQLAPTLAYDSSFISTASQIKPMAVTPKVKALFCNLDEYFLYLHGVRKYAGFDNYDLQHNVIVIPYDSTDVHTRSLIIKAMVHTTMDWWYTRLVKSMGVYCHGNRSANKDAILALPLASVLKLNSTKLKGNYHILFVTRSGIDYDTLQLGRATSNVTINRIREGADVTVDISATINQWINTTKFEELRSLLMDELRYLADHNVANAFPNAISLLAETCYQLPMPKLYTSSGKLANGYCWDKHEAADPQIKFETFQRVSPMATIQDELESSGYGKLQGMLDDFVLRHQTPFGLLQPGRLNVSINTNDEVIPENSSLLTSSNYSCHVADNMAKTSCGVRIHGRANTLPLLHCCRII